jgi:hypothetical protein
VSFAQTHRPKENSRLEPSIPAKESDHEGAASEDYFDYRITPESQTNFYSVGSLQFPKANIDTLIGNIGKVEDIPDLYRNADLLLSYLRNDEKTQYHSIVTDLTHIKGKLERGYNFTKKEVDDYNKKIHEFAINLLNTKGGANLSLESTEISLSKAIEMLNDLDRKRADGVIKISEEYDDESVTLVTKAAEQAIEKSRDEIIGTVAGVEAVARNTAQVAATALNGIPFGRRLTAEEAAKESWGIGWTGIPPETASDIIDQNKNKRISGFFVGARNLAKKTIEAVKQHKGKKLTLAVAALVAIGGSYWLKNRGDHKISEPAIEAPERPVPEIKSSTPDLSSPGFAIEKLEGIYEPGNTSLIRDLDKPNRLVGEDRKYENTPIVNEQMIKECQNGKYTYMIKCIREVVDGQKSPLKKQLVDMIHTAAKERAQKERVNFDKLSDKEKSAYVDAVIGGSGIKPPEGKDPKEWFRGLKDKTPASYIADKLGLFSITYSFTSGVNRNIKNLGVHIKMPGVGEKITPELVVEAIEATLKK